MKVNVMSNILKANDLLAGDISRLLKEKGVFSLNIMGSPGSGKTTLLEKIIPMFPEDKKVAVIEGDIATTRDAERIARTGVQSSQINTNGGCHLDAAMVRSALDTLNLDDISVLFIENVGNLVCPSGFSLGEDGRIIVSSITEGDDKPEKYPSMFRTGDLILVNKMDLISRTNFSLDLFVKGMNKINPGAKIIPISATDGTGLEDVLSWIIERSSDRLNR